MEKTVKVSVLIPAYNEELYIDQCLESVMKQTLREIEIIVVDACSTDGTLAHIEAAAERDSRICVIRQTENRGLLQARKDAVLASQGEYVTFLDGDDYLERDACKKIYENAVKSDADILQFGICIENCGNLPMETVQGYERWLNSYQTTVFLGQPLVRNYTERLMSVMILQKAVKGETAKRAFKKMSDLCIDAEEDQYITCLILMESRSLSKIPEKLYHYCYGRGLYGCRTVTAQDFPFYCGGVTTYREFEKYVSELSPECGEEFIVAGKEAVERLKKSVLVNQVDTWLNYMRPEDQAEAFRMLERAWQTAPGGVSFLSLLAQYAWDKRAEIAEALAGAEWLKFEGRPIKTIGLYYRRFRNGGAQRSVSRLGSQLAELRDEDGKPKYRVVLISDEAPNEEDYPMSPLVIREQVPPYQESTAEKFAPRADKWQEIIARHRIDAVFYSLWMNDNLLWDLLSVKRAEGHPAFAIHAHNFCAMMYVWQEANIQERQRVFHLADSVITLSQIDQRYWLRFNPRSVYILNPCLKASECRRASYGKHVLWLGRIAWEKQPLEIPRIMREVCARDPEIVCHVVGADDANLENSLRESLAAEGLSGRVILEGFHKDVNPYYESCSLFLLTSSFEGFTYTLFESAAHGLPTVLYELPWLEYNRLIDGAVTVPQLDAVAAAEAIVRIVNDPAEWQRRSDALYDSARRFEETDISACWNVLLESLEKGTLPDEPRFDRETEILLDQIDRFHDDALHGLIEMEEELKAIKASVSFRVGRAITWLPRKLRDGLRLCWERGGKDAAERILYHLRLEPDNEKQ